MKTYSVFVMFTDETMWTYANLSPPEAAEKVRLGCQEEGCIGVQVIFEYWRKNESN